MSEWEECEVSGHLINGDYYIWDNAGVWYLDQKVDWDGFVNIGEFDSEQAAMDACEGMSDD